MEVEGLFDLSSCEQIMESLRKRGIQAAGQVVLKRVISRGGKSRAYVNGNFITLQELSELGKSLLNIYGQHEHQMLLQEGRHLDLLDEFGGVVQLREQWAELWEERRRLLAELEETRERIQRTREKRELWEFQLAEIEGAELRPQEDRELEEERRRLLHAKRIRDGLALGEELLYSERGSALDRIHTVLKELESLREVEPRVGALLEALEGASVQMEEAVHDIRQLNRLIEEDPQRLEQVEERLGEINRLKRKYEGGIEEILQFAQKIRQELQELEAGEDALSGISSRIEGVEARLVELGERLREARYEAARRLKKEVEGELRDLGINEPLFEARITPIKQGERLGDDGPVAGPKGLDEVAFYLSTNVGEPPRALSRIASGGELSRIMLALKRSLADAGRIPTLIFDEIDAGIGGAVAEAVGEKLRLISRTHQVLCITHLPQIASLADNHLHVSKQQEAGRTITRVIPLSPDQRVEELSRMLGGRVITQRTRDHAKELLERALSDAGAKGSHSSANSG
jgi:DNA repair protein RecN (Recombination protein N)